MCPSTYLLPKLTEAEKSPLSNEFLKFRISGYSATTNDELDF